MKTQGLAKSANDLTVSELGRAAKDLKVPLEAMVQFIAVTGFDAAARKKPSSLDGDLSPGAVTANAGRDPYGTRELSAFKKMTRKLTTGAAYPAYFDSSRRAKTQTQLQELFTSALSPENQRAARLWLASEGNTFALEAVDKSSFRLAVDRLLGVIFMDAGP